MAESASPYLDDPRYHRMQAGCLNVESNKFFFVNYIFKSAGFPLASRLKSDIINLVWQ
jgi:hypothetical protein